MQKQITPQNSPAQTTSSSLLKVARNKIVMHGALAVFTIVIVVILVFAMTTAWYTNVIETSGLIFEAEAWGFEGEVVVQDSAIEAVPGDSGVVDLTIVNNSDDVSAITVSVSKQSMSGALCERIFFYVDEQRVINGETVNKQYLTNTSGHTYTLFSQNTMILTEDLHTDSLLKWEWVYDVVGYYFRGTVTADANGNVSAVAEEYLRPVEYNYDLATYTTDEAGAAADDPGQLLTIDGETTRNQFLAQVTATDGYEGAFTVGAEDALLDQDGKTVTVIGNNYRVYQDDDQEIWLYLCTKDDIEYNTQWDTNFGVVQAGGTPTQFQARITVTAQQIQQQAVTISNPADLSTSLNEAAGGIVRLESDMVVTEAVELTGDTSAVLDLDGHTITYTGKDNAFVLEDGGILTVLNGTVQGDGKTESTAFYTTGGQVTLSNVVVKDTYMGVNIEDHKTESTQGANSFIRIVDSEITTSDISIKINGDGVLSGTDTHLVIQDSTIVSEEYVGIMGNGNASNPGNWGTDIQILNSKVSGYYAGIYHPQQQSNLTISESEISGFTGMAIKGGDVLVIDSTVKGTGNKLTVPTEAMLNGSGFVDTGDGIYIETDYEYPITIEITGDKSIVSTAVGMALRVFPEATYVNVTITGGQFKTDVAAYLTDTYQSKVNADGYYVVSKK